MEYTYAALLLNEVDEELNEENLTRVLDAAGYSPMESRIKALVAALENVDVDQIGPADHDSSEIQTQTSTEANEIDFDTSVENDDETSPEDGQTTGESGAATPDGGVSQE